MAFTDEIDHAEHAYWRAFCPECGTSPCEAPGGIHDDPEHRCRWCGEGLYEFEGNWFARRDAGLICRVGPGGGEYPEHRPGEPTLGWLADAIAYGVLLAAFAEYGVTLEASAKAAEAVLATTAIDGDPLEGIMAARDSADSPVTYTA